MKAELIDVMGDDLRVVNAARVSFDKQSVWDKVETDIQAKWDFYEVVYDSFIQENVTKYYKYGQLSEKDTKLIRYLAKHGHFTPFTHPQITMRETVPIFVARQRFKHTVGFTYNEMSRRYVDDEPEFFEPVWRKRPDKSIKQGSGEAFDVPGQAYCWKIKTHAEEAALEAYKKLLDRGAAPEQARMVLPQSMYTSYYVTGSLAAWARAYNLREDRSKAQGEIADLAEQWNKIIFPLFPISWEALVI